MSRDNDIQEVDFICFATVKAPFELKKIKPKFLVKLTVEPFSGHSISDRSITNLSTHLSSLSIIYTVIS